MPADDVQADGWRLGILALVVFGAMGILLSRLWNVQVVNSQSALRTLDATTTVKARIAPARGAICDRNGVPLATNRPSFDIDFYLDDMRRDYAESHHGRVPKIALPPDKKGRKRSEDDIVEIVRESIAPVKDALGLTAPLTDKDEKDIREHFRTNHDLPYHYMRDLDFATVANFEERNLGVTGIRIAQSPAREYPYGALASHILGYVGKPVNQMEHLSSDGTPYETIGRHGIEAVMDPQLQGEPGSIIRRVNELGYYINAKAIHTEPPTMGNTLFLTIDARIQYIAETAMAKSGWTRGSVIVMNPNNGDVLALASFPNYDPNKFIPSISTKDWDTLNEDPTTPLYNRALHGFQPGSTYKIMVALAGLQSGHVTPNTEIDCPGAIQIDDHLFHNSDRSAAGTMSLINAIKVSSDVFFYQYGIKAGIEAIDAMGARAGFGHKWGLLGDDDEEAGILPGPQWMKDNDDMLKKTHNIDHWSNAQTANTAIGQGFVLVTPLQMATFLCAVANGGTVYQPRLYSHVENYKRDTIATMQEGTVYNTLNVKPSDLKAVQQGMYEVVEEEGGTGNLTAKIPGVHLAGKTGTAQAYRRLDGVRKQDLSTWFYCYGPFESPRYVVCVLVQGGQWGGTAAAPIASEVMKRCLALDAGGTEDVSFLQPIVGNFKGVTDVETHEASKPDDTAGSTDNADSTSPPGDVPPATPATPAGAGNTRHR